MVKLLTATLTFILLSSSVIAGPEPTPETEPTQIHVKTLVLKNFLEVAGREQGDLQYEDAFIKGYAVHPNIVISTDGRMDDAYDREKNLYSLYLGYSALGLTSLLTTQTLEYDSFEVVPEEQRRILRDTILELSKDCALGLSDELSTEELVEIDISSCVERVISYYQ